MRWRQATSIITLRTPRLVLRSAQWTPNHLALGREVPLAFWTVELERQRLGFWFASVNGVVSKPVLCGNGGAKQ